MLNIILQSKGVMLRIDAAAGGEMLYLQNLTEMAREDIPTFTAQVPPEITDDQIVTLVLPLKIADVTSVSRRRCSSRPNFSTTSRWYC